VITILTTLRDLLERWWADFNLQTRLMAIATLVVSVVMSGLTFWAVDTIQVDARLNDTRFGRDLGLLLAANITPLAADNNLTELARFSHRFYSGTASVRYIIYADADGKIRFGIPFSDSEVQSSLTIERRIQLPEGFAARSDDPMVRQHLTPNGVVTDVFVPLNNDGKYLGVLAIGTNPNPATISSSSLTRDVTTAVFVSIWVMVILGAVFNALTVTKPIKELLNGVENIAQGNFKQRVDSPLSGEFKALMQGFNVMADQLERYEEQNIEELTAEKAKLDTLVSTIADGAVLLDPDLHIVLANAAAQRIFQWDGQGIAGKKATDSLPQIVKETIARPLQQMASGDATESAEFQIVLSEPKRTIRILLNRVLGSNQGTAKGIALTIQDVTREAELNEAKGQFISNISHELRTPLFNIKSFIETLYEYGDALEPAQQREFLETANRETDRLTRLVNDVLDLSRLESGKAYAFDAVEHQAIDQTLRTYQLNARDKGIELRQELAPNLPNVWGNYDLILQVFGNLLGNALKFTTSEGVVTIRAYPLAQCELAHQAQMIRVEIADTGIGIDTEDQSGVFERFFRAENRVHTLEGTGLGLSIVRNILDKHDSHIQLVSEVGVGTTFWFDLKIAPAHVTTIALDEFPPAHPPADLVAPTAAYSAN
jgi:two-component system, OmpR family, sensor histidine kinase NblS